MGKVFSNCRICKQKRFLNFASLCKRCNQKEISSEIKEKAIEQKQEVVESKGEKQEEKIENLKEKQALEDKNDLTAEQKRRLVDLTPGVNDIAELEKEIENKK